ncbi:hypothetical protein C8Q80DRAFT_270947 [Daedaleopsis nitida]|nr:hypothetical protein C8Q80DRAFT_270947 [Daedaleopsis nitida]
MPQSMKPRYRYTRHHVACACVEGNQKAKLIVVPLLVRGTTRCIPARRRHVSRSHSSIPATGYRLLVLDDIRDALTARVLHSRFLAGFTRPTSLHPGRESAALEQNVQVVAASRRADPRRLFVCVDHTGIRNAKFDSDVQDAAFISASWPASVVLCCVRLWPSSQLTCRQGVCPGASNDQPLRASDSDCGTLPVFRVGGTPDSALGFM